MEVLYNRLSNAKLEDKNCNATNRQILSDVAQFLEEDDNPDQAVLKMVDCGVVKSLISALNSENNDIYQLVAKLIAEIAKRECSRKPLVECGSVNPLLKHLHGNATELSIQCCRALGNICFDNDEGRNAVDEAGGVEIVCSTLQQHVNTTGGEDAKLLRRVLCGALLNITNSTESLQDKAVSCGAIDTLNTYLKKCADDVSTLQMALLALNTLLESDEAEKEVCKCDVPQTVVRLLSLEEASDITDTAFEVLHTLAENDVVKVQLCSEDITQRLLAVISQHQHDTQNDESLNIVKLASDLINILLTGDESMDKMYAEGQGQVFNTSQQWLRSHHLTLQAAGALAIGNFARKDKHCVEMVKQGTHNHLLTCLEEHADSSPSLQHAIFSALRNLAIPPENKKILMEEGLLEKIIPIAYTAEFTPVIFKMLATLRMLVDGQEAAATRLGSDEELLRKILKWCRNEEHAGVKGESQRLIAFIVRHSGSSGVMETVAKVGGVTPLCNMMHCDHALMQSEAIVALTIMSAVCLEKLEDALVEAELVPAIKVVITDDDTLSEILNNVCQLVLTTAKSETLLELYRLADFPQIFEKLQDHDESLVRGQAHEVYKNIAPK